LKRGDVLVKFGRREFMERLHESGALRVQPATYFSQTEHNGAGITNCPAARRYGA
jgi:hypothetical protein